LVLGGVDTVGAAVVVTQQWLVRSLGVGSGFLSSAGPAAILSAIADAPLLESQIG
jgi:hypothetical protein